MRTDEAYMLYAGALNYVDGAQIICQHPEFTGRDRLILPTHTLIGLAIEMLLKAVYLHKGGDPAILRKPNTRHGLQQLRSLASSVGFDLAFPVINQIINHISDNYRKHEYRYIRTGIDINWINVQEAIPSLLQFCDQVAVVIDVSPRSAAAH